MATCYLRMGDDYLEDAKRFPSKASAVEAFRDTAKELAHFGQPIAASIHYAPNKAELAEYPDFVLSLGPRGGVKVERA